MASRQEEIFFEIHRDNPREGPGSFEATRQAFSRLHGLPEKPLLLDVGCGPGRQTLDLAELSPHQAGIYAVDTHEPFIDRLRSAAASRGLSDRIFPMIMDMNSLPFKEETFDVIWAEGSIYIMGFENGFKKWKPLLKPQGYIAVTEIAWLRDNPPEQVKVFWEQNYPAIKSVPDNLAIIADAGYHLIDYFVLPENDWWDNYYTHIEKKIMPMKLKYRNDPEALEVIHLEEAEMDLYRKYSAYYGYVFHIARKQ